MFRSILSLAALLAATACATAEDPLEDVTVDIRDFARDDGGVDVPDEAGEADVPIDVDVPVDVDAPDTEVGPDSEVADDSATEADAEVRDDADAAEEVAPAVCGDGTLAGAEECDDGNTDDADGCSATCTLEYCGDGVTGTNLPVADDLESDDLSRLPWAPAAPYGFAPSATHVHSGARALGPANIGRATSTARVSLRARTDGEVCFWFAGESESCCDDFRFLVDGAPLLERAGSYTTWTEFCTTVSAGFHDFVLEYQKDGSVNTGWDAFYVDDVRLSGGNVEDCDDGGTAAGDGCGPTCLREECGNSYLDPGEQCDDGNLESTDACTASCRNALCGDANVDWSPPGDGLETGDLTQLPWSAGAGTSGWAVVRAPAAAHAGLYGLVSQNAGRASSTGWVELPLTTVAAGSVCFWYRGESESGYDYFNFVLDGVQVSHISGSHTAWAEACFDVPTPGPHSFRWEYTKDGSVDTGNDAWSIDDVRFPPVAETCDDGNTVAGDGCSSTCRIE